MQPSNGPVLERHVPLSEGVPDITLEVFENINIHVIR